MMMAFALTVTKLIEAMQQPGCPVCRRTRLSASQAVGSFLWENVTDITTRKRIIASYGFCPLHTRLMVSTELSTSGPPVGVNMVYEQLGRIASQELKSWQQDRRGGGWRGVLKRLGLNLPSTRERVLAPKAICPMCEVSDVSAANTISAFLQELDHGTEDVSTAYAASDGLCMAHLRMALEQFSQEHPRATGWLAEDTANRLERLSAAMQEYLRKNNWEYRDEKVTPEENQAWLKMLTFFTGYPAEKFGLRVEEFEK